MSWRDCAPVQGVAWEPIARLHRDVRELFAESGALLGEDVPEPAVTLELPADDPEPFHVFTLTGAHDFEVERFLSDGVLTLSFQADVVCVASGDTYEEAAEAANAYHALLMQVPLCDPTLGGAVNEVGAPQVADYRTWADTRRHAGYRLSYSISTDVAASEAARRVIEGSYQ